VHNGNNQPAVNSEFTPTQTGNIQSSTFLL
jgi:hypothetical protein